jgi:hypothetical protein
MSLLQPQGLHERRDIVREQLGGIDAFRLVGFACAPEVERDTGKMFGVLRELKGIACVIRSQVWDKNEGFSGSLLFIVHDQLVGFHLGHGNCLLTVRTSPARAPGGREAGLLRAFD